MHSSGMGSPFGSSCKNPNIVHSGWPSWTTRVISPDVLLFPVFSWQPFEEQDEEEQEVENNYQGDKDGCFEDREHTTSLDGTSLLVSRSRAYRFNEGSVSNTNL